MCLFASLPGPTTQLRAGHGGKSREELRNSLPERDSAALRRLTSAQAALSASPSVCSCLRALRSAGVASPPLRSPTPRPLVSLPLPLPRLSLSSRLPPLPCTSPRLPLGRPSRHPASARTPDARPRPQGPVVPAALLGPGCCVFSPQVWDESSHIFPGDGDCLGGRFDLKLLGAPLSSILAGSPAGLTFLPAPSASRRAGGEGSRCALTPGHRVIEGGKPGNSTPNFSLASCLTVRGKNAGKLEKKWKSGELPGIAHIAFKTMVTIEVTSPLALGMSRDPLPPGEVIYGIPWPSECLNPFIPTPGGGLRL
uniref:uncharacterized protein LOC108588331 n=1 Tax=Callithrix jacchus TaxID=9483 RepID=UPI0023DD21F3|nr:uncharacterized protein LOC108588331 [Callithrix jacchus]